MKKKKYSAGRKSALKKALILLIIVAVCTVFAISGLVIYGEYQMGKIPGLSFQEALEYTTNNCDGAIITVGIIKDGNASYTVYGTNGAELSQELHTYEIGSLTKTLTAALINRSVQEGKIDLSASIAQYIALPEGNAYPTVEELLTHTSGYKGYYFERPMISNFIHGRNDFYGITKEMIIRKAGELSLPDEYKFNYSNYGYAVLGVILENVHGESYKTLMNQFLQTELGLSHTQISEKNGDLGKYWDWNNDDAYLAAGAVTSDIADMLAYAQMQLDQNEYFADCHMGLKAIDASSAQYEMLGIGMDEIGMAWIIDSENSIIWHNGGTDDYNCYLGFDPETGTAVVILSNISPNYRIPATVLGVKALNELRE